MQPQCLLGPNYMTAMTQLFRLQLPSDLVSVWFHTTTRWWFWMPAFTGLEFRLPGMLSSTFQSAWTASKPHIPARGTNSQHWWLEAGGWFQGTQSLLWAPLQKETKWLCCWELLQIAPLWMWWWQHVNFHTYNWLIFKFCIPLWDEKSRRRFLATTYQWCVSELWELCGLLPHYLSVGTDPLALVQVSHPWTLLSALRIAWC